MSIVKNTKAIYQESNKKNIYYIGKVLVIYHIVLISLLISFFLLFPTNSCCQLCDEPVMVLIYEPEYYWPQYYCKEHSIQILKSYK